MAHKHKKKKQPIDPQDVLTGKISLSSLELIRMIHRVNPTGEEVRPEEASQRYQLKAKLQSLLIRLYNHQLRVEQTDANQPQLIGLRLLHFSEDACHAFMQELDEDARSWVQRQIDVDNFDHEPVSSVDTSASLLSSWQDHSANDAGTPDVASSEELLVLGRKALEEYDYEQCELYYRQAFMRSPSNVELALLLMDLWIDHLAAYEKALAFAEKISNHMIKNKNVRIRLGLACARIKRIESALEWIDMILEPAAAEIYYLAVQRFIEEHDAPRALGALALLKSCQSIEFAAKILHLENGIRALHVKALAPLEEEMNQAWQSGAFEKASQLAQELLSSLPDNRAARKILHEFKEREQNRKIARWLQLADEAKNRNDLVSEADMLSRAVATGENSDALKQRLKKVQQEVRRRREEKEIENVIASVNKGDIKKTLLAYMELNSCQREQLRNSLGYPHFLWIDQALAAEISVKPEMIAEAVIVLGESQAALERGADPQHVIYQVQLYSKALQYIPLMRDILRQAEMLLKTQERLKNEELLKQAQNALADNDIELTRELLEQIKVKRLEHNEKNLYDVITGTLNKLAEIQILSQKFTERLNRKDHIAAREIADRLATLTQGEEEAAWREKMENSSARIKEEWRLATSDIAQLPRCYALLGLKDMHDLRQSCLLPDGCHLLLATGYGCWIFLRTFCLEDQQFKKGYILRSPKSIDFLNITPSGNIIWITGESGYLIAVSPDPFDIVFGKDFSEFIGDSWNCEDEWIFPGNRYLWLNKSGIQGNREMIIEIVDIDQRRNSRQIKCTGLPIVINCGGEFRVAMTSYKSKAIRMFSESGKLIDTYTLETSIAVHAAALHPNGADIVFLPYDDTTSDTSGEDPEDGEDFLLTLEIRPDVERKNKPVKIPGTNGEAIHSLFTSMDAGIVYTYFENQSEEDGRYNLAAWKPSEQGLTMLYRVPAPRDFIYATDEFSKRVAAIEFSNTRLKAVILDERPPEFDLDSDKTDHETDIPSFNPPWFCSSPTGPLKAISLALVAKMQVSPPRDVYQIIDEMKETAEPDEIAALANALAVMNYYEQSRDLESWMKETYPDHYIVQIKLAEDALKNSDWQGIITIINGIDFEGNGDDGSGRHSCHLLGIAYFATGDVKTALTAWKKGLQYENGKCDLRPYIEYAELSLLSPQGREKRKTGSSIAKMLNLFDTIDDHMSKGEWDAVITLIESDYHMERADEQILARLAQAYLNMNYEAGAVRRLSKIIALAYYGYCFNKPYKKPLCLPPCIETWSNERLNAVFVEAEHWLERA